MSSSSSSSSLGNLYSRKSAHCTALAQVRQSLAERRRGRSGTAGAAAARVATAPAAPSLSTKMSKVNDYRFPLSEDGRVYHNDRKSAAAQHGHTCCGSLKQRCRQQPSTAPNVLPSHMADDVSPSASSSPSPSAPHLQCRFSNDGCFVVDTPGAHKRFEAVFTDASLTDNPLPLPMSVQQTESEMSFAAVDWNFVCNPATSSNTGSRPRLHSVLIDRSQEGTITTERPHAAALGESLVEAMVSTAERMLENEKRRDSAAQCHRQPQPRRDSPSSKSPIARAFTRSSCGSLSAKPRHPTTTTTPITNRSVTALGSTATDFLFVLNDSDGRGCDSVGSRHTTATGPPRHPLLLLAPSPHHSGGTEDTSPPLNNPSYPAACALTTPTSLDGTERATNCDGARSGGAMVSVGAKSVAPPQLSHHQLTEAFYCSYKSGKMAQDAYRYFAAQLQHKKQRSAAASVTRRRPYDGVGEKVLKGSKKQTVAPPPPPPPPPPPQQQQHQQHKQPQPTVTSGAASPAQPLTLLSSPPTPQSVFWGDIHAAVDGKGEQHQTLSKELSGTAKPIISIGTSDSGDHASRSCGTVDGASRVSPPQKLSATDKPATVATTDRIGALLRKSMSIYQESFRVK